MKRFGLLILAATIGSLLTFGMIRITGLGGKILRVEHVDGGYQTKLASNVTYGNVPFDFSAAAEIAMPAVVHIQSTQTGNYNSQTIDPFNFFFGDDFFGRDYGQNQAQVATGSGVIISNDGYIVTNNHVIANADDIQVSLYNNKNYKAKLIGTDPSTDLALLKIDEKNLNFLKIGNSDAAKVGEWVLAVGNPFNFTSTVTAGIVSAKGRNLHILKDQSAIESFIQTDAAVNPGNSGGALVNLNGELIGINTAIASPTGVFAGYSFAIPANIVNKIIEDLLQYGIVQRGYLGIMIRSVDGTMANEFGLAVTEGVYVDGFSEDGSAENSGIKKGDVIVSINETEIKNSAELQEIVGRHRPGDALNITVNRSGSVKNFIVTLKNSKGNTETVTKDASSMLNNWGVQLKDLDDATKRKLRIDGGVQITELTRGKLAEQTNIKEGFIILRINGQKVKSVDQVTQMLADYQGGVMLEGMYPGYSGVYYYAFGM